MTEHLSSEVIENYRRRQVDPAALREIDAHLASCQACVESILDAEHAGLAYESVSQAFMSAKGEAPFHLSQTDLENYLAGNVDQADRVVFGSHLEDCATCETALQTRADSAERQAVTPIASDNEPRSSWVGQPWSTPARAAAVLAVLAFIALGIVVWRRQQSHDNQAVRSVPPNQSSPQPSVSPDQQPPESVSIAVAVLKDNNREIKLDQDGRLTGLESFDESSQRIAQVALKGEAPAKPAILASLATANINLRGGPEGETFQIVGPVGRIVADDRPTFRWRPLSQAGSYVVSIFDEKFSRVAQSGPLTTTQWRPETALKRGQIYSWEVKATRDNEEFSSPAAPSGAAKFAILEGQQFGELNKLKRQAPVSHLVLGMQYARAGMVSEAESEFRQLLKENPDSAIAKKLLRSVQGWK